MWLLSMQVTLWSHPNYNEIHHKCQSGALLNPRSGCVDVCSRTLGKNADFIHQSLRDYLSGHSSLETLISLSLFINPLHFLCIRASALAK